MLYTCSLGRLCSCGSVEQSTCRIKVCVACTVWLVISRVEIFMGSRSLAQFLIFEGSNYYEDYDYFRGL